MQNEGRLNQTLELYEEAAALAEKAEGSEQIGSGISHNNTGNILMELHRPAEALAQNTKSQEILERGLGTDRAARPRQTHARRDPRAAAAARRPPPRRCREHSFRSSHLATPP
ncbi:MAG: hypothetical protein ACRBN8_11140 [Nannocystales bacterium]